MHILLMLKLIHNKSKEKALFSVVTLETDISGQQRWVAEQVGREEVIPHV